MGTKSKAVAAPSIDQDWQAQSDLRTLAEARAIKADPKRMEAVRRVAEHQMRAAAAAASEVTKD
jgi:hypothetical protein